MWRRMASLKEALMIGAAACLVLGLTPGVASAQTCEFAQWGFDISTTGTPKLQAETSEEGDAGVCGQYGTQTEGWIAGISSVYCSWGTRMASGSSCYEYHDGPYSYVQVRPTAPGRYGTWMGLAKHWRIAGPNPGVGNPYEWHLIGGDFPATILYSGEYPYQSAECAEWEYWDDLEGRCIAYNSPILIPLTRAQAVKLTSPEGGVLFDIDADGDLDQTAWTETDSRMAFLAIDRNGNGVIDNGSEMFGDNTLPGVKNGFSALQRMNMALNGGKAAAFLNSDEPLFAKLLLWEDANHNGISEASELQPATNVVSNIGLGYEVHKRRDGHGNLFMFKGFAYVRTAPGKNLPLEAAAQKERQIDIYDVLFKSQR